MKIKEICLCIDREDILNFSKYQHEVEITNIEIGKEIKGEGNCIIKGIAVNFEIVADIEEISSKKVYISIKEFRALKMNIPDIIKNLALNLILNAFTRIEGISFEQNFIVIDINKISKKININTINLDNFEIIDIEFLNNEIEVKLGNILVASARN